MKSIVVSIVDVLGIFVPGFLLLAGIMLFPVAIGYSSSYKAMWAALPEAIRTNTTAIGIILLITSYVIGFIIRLISISLLQKLTRKMWVAKITKEAEALRPVLDECLNYPALTTAMKELGSRSSSNRIGGYAPHYSIARGIIRNASPAFRQDADRLEADVRFTAGLFIPLLILTIDGLSMVKLFPFGTMLFFISLVGCITILYTFPHRRIREVVQVYFMAIVTLRYMSSISTTAIEKEMD